MEEVIRPGYTRVTDILRPWNNLEGIPKDILERKRIIGVKVHDAIRTYYDGFPVDALQSDVGTYFDSFLEWQNDVKAIAVKTEERYYDDVLKITGCVDALLRFPEEDQLVMLDWKTSASYTKKMGVTWALQGCFYHYLMMQNDIPNVSTKFIFLQLSPEGKYPKVREFEYTSEMMAACCSAVQMHNLYNPSKEEKC